MLETNKIESKWSSKDHRKIKGLAKKSAKAIKKKSPRDAKNPIKNLRVSKIQIEKNSERPGRAYNDLEKQVKKLKAEVKQVKDNLKSEITIREEIEKALRQSEEHIRSLMVSAGSFAVYRLFYDEEDAFKPKVIFVSPSISGLLGIQDPQDFQTWLNNIHPDDLERVRRSYCQSCKTLKFEEIVRVFNTQENEWRHIKVIATGFKVEDSRSWYANGIIIDITEREKMKELLEAKSVHLEELNNALRVLLKKNVADEKRLEEKVILNVKKLILPKLKKLKKTGLNERQVAFLNALEADLNNIISPFSSTLAFNYYNLTISELQVANLIKLGKATKDIASILNLSKRTVEVHRNNIRTKLGIKNRNINLRSHMLLLEDMR